VARQVFDRIARLAFAFLALVGIISCGSGAVSGPPTVVTPGPISITPSTATLYTDLPTMFLITGGTGSYFITSSNQAVIPVIGSFAGSEITVVPGPVAADTPVTLSVRDTAATTPATATLTVKPRTVSNIVTVTPSASQSAACGTSVCSGGDAEVKATLSQAGVPLSGRTVRFDVVSGDVRIISSAAGLPETLSLSDSTTTDTTGTARIRVRVLPDATAQTALLQITDVNSGSTQRTSVSIAPSSNAPLNAQPATIAFRGATGDKCASTGQADVIVFGGRPPYSISQPGTFTVNPTLVGSSGGRFTVTPTGQCTDGSPIAIVDSNGATVSISASNRTGSTSATPAFVAAPTDVTLDSCNTVATVALAGGSGTYFAASGNNAVAATVNGNTGVIQRSASAGPVSTPVNVVFSDGQTTRQVTVNLAPGAKGTCP
jgi:hypothetical protein